MGELQIEAKQVVVPGQVLATGLDYLPSYGTYRESNNIHASKVGTANIDGRTIKVMPIAGKYSPRTGDTIIGRIIDVSLSGWIFNINTAYRAMLISRDATSDFISRDTDLTKIFDIGDYVVAKIVNVTSQKLVDLTTKGP